MKRYLLVPALLISTLSTGCFTTIGAVAGSSTKTADGKKDPYAAGRGALVGAVLDVALLALFINSVDFDLYGSDEDGIVSRTSLDHAPAPSPLSFRSR